MCGIASLATQSARRFGSAAIPQAERRPPSAGLTKSETFPFASTRTILRLRIEETKNDFVFGS